jgi:hypothetical protein
VDRVNDYPATESTDDLKFDPSGGSFLRDRVGGRGVTPLSKYSNQLHGDTAIVAETGEKLPV